MNRYICNDGDRLDVICSRHYGRVDGNVIYAVLDVNPGLADKDTFESGTVIYLPELEVHATELVQNKVRLWN